MTGVMAVIRSQALRLNIEVGTIQIQAETLHLSTSCTLTVDPGARDRLWARAHCRVRNNNDKTDKDKSATP
jgi:hypothetical protein